MRAGDCRMAEAAESVSKCGWPSQLPVGGTGELPAPGPSAVSNHSIESTCLNQVWPPQRVPWWSSKGRRKLFIVWKRHMNVLRMDGLLERKSKNGLCSHFVGKCVELWFSLFDVIGSLYFESWPQQLKPLVAWAPELQDLTRFKASMLGKAGKLIFESCFLDEHFFKTGSTEV